MRNQFLLDTILVSEHIPESISERYQIKSVLGRGGMGIVLHAYDPFLGIDVAVKFMRSDDSGKTAARMQREAMAAGKLKHANIARVYDFGKTPQDEPYMVMELLQGKSLAQKMQESQPDLIPAKEAVSIFIQISDGLQAAHTAHVIHRDLKPDNVFLLENGTVKLVDFGIAQIGEVEQNKKTERGFEGSPLYMSPEQAKSEETDARSDIYSFGCLMLEVLSGKPPFVGKSAIETVSMQINCKAPLVKEFCKEDLPNELTDLVQLCLEKDPLLRPQNCDQISSSLEVVLSILKKREIVVSAPVSTPQENSIRKEENLLKIMFAMVILLVITTCAGLYVVLTQKKPTTQQASKDTDKIDFAAEPEQMIWPKSTEVKNNSFKNKFEFAEDKGIYMVRQRLAFTDEDLKMLKGYIRLRYLLFDLAQIDGSGLAYLADLPVTRFNNNFGAIKDENMKYLGQMKNLDHLSLSSPYITDKGLKELLHLKKLVALGLGSDKITDQSINTFSRFQNLNSFSLFAPLMTDNITSALLKMKNLETVYLIKMKLSPDIGVKLAHLKHLKNIGLLELDSVSDASLQAISKLKLNWLALDDTKLGDNQLAHLSENLGGISLRKTKISAKNLENLKRVKLLNKLDLSGNIISDDHIKIVSRLKLKELTLVQTNLTFNQLLMLSNMETLNKLNIQDCVNITPNQLLEFQREFSLKHRRQCEVKVGAIEDELLERFQSH